ncbi:MAG TPA: homocysteine S-methyltransferase family protein [Candidatus Acidoferrales bacterium]|nr:homocysteine S-methyltransferase family protein [Candidatus Acidoferrales bacterium]
MKRIKERVLFGEILLSDGAWGTMLHSKGLKIGDCPERWNLERRADVLDVAKSYVDAGSDMIETNSFGGSKFKLDYYGLGDRVVDVNRIAAEISREAAGDIVYVLGSVGPTGKMLLTGDVTKEELYECFGEQAKALEAGGADAIVVETMFDLDEAKCAIKAAKENTKCEVICTMTFDSSGTGFHTMMGTTPEVAARSLMEAGADIIGSNCGNGVENMVSIVRQMRSVDGKIPILVQANAGLPMVVEGKTIFPETPEAMARWINPLIDGGANIIGGCCGTTPEHIRKIAEVVRAS